MDSNFYTILLEKKLFRLYDYIPGDVFEYDDTYSPCPLKIRPFVGLQIISISYQFEFARLTFNNFEWEMACKTQSYSEYLEEWLKQHPQQRRKRSIDFSLR